MFPAVAVNGVNLTLGATTVLQDLSVLLGRGEVGCMLGENGAGKSVTISVVAGLRLPDSGDVLVCGHRPSSRQCRRIRAVVLQDPEFPPLLRVVEIVDLVASHYGAVDRDILGGLGVERLSSQLAHTLSGGERQRVAVALALMTRPEVLVLDEPTASVDREHKEATWAALHKLTAEGVTVLLATHDLEEAAALGSELLLLSGGRIVYSGSPQDTIKRLRVGRVEFTVDDQSDVSALPSAVSTKVTERGCARSILVATADTDAYVRSLVLSGVDFKNLRLHSPTLGDAIDQVFADEMQASGVGE